MGSDTDYPTMAEAGKTLEKLGIVYEMEVTSAHRSPGRTHEYATSAASRGLKCIIVGAGGAAHLAGVVAAVTTLPVIGVPLATTPLNGMVSLLSCRCRPESRWQRWRLIRLELSTRRSWRRKSSDYRTPAWQSD